MSTYLKNMKWYLLSLLLIPISINAQKNTGSRLQLPINNNQVELSNNRILVDDIDNTRGDSLWIHYDDVDNFDAWGFLISGEEYDIVSKWDASDLTSYDGWVITKIKFIVVNSTPYLTLKVWEGANFTEIYSQELDSWNVNSWTEVTLDNPVEFDHTQELYIGYHVDMTHTELGGFVTATDDGPPEDDYGNLCRWNGSWYSEFNNHNLQAFIKANLNADFEADNHIICVGGTVNFTNLSSAEETYNWTFEGGTPAASTDENPSVTYNTTGVYDVTLEVSLGSDTDTEYKQGYIHVLDIPGQAEVPEGESSVCSGLYYDYAINPVLYAQDYEWEISPANAGTLTPNDTSAQLIVADDWTGDFIISVRATNLCGDGDWSDDFEGTVFQSPTAYNLQGGGGYCLNGDGAEITLDGSESNVDYELYLNGEATGNIVEGTGSEISFGLITEEGFYTAIGNNDNCDMTMNEQIEIEVLFPPLEPETPTGPEVICTETSSDYSSEGTDDADSYVWVLAPEEAGTITFEELNATVDWNSEFTGTAMVSLYGINECGDGNLSAELEISVGSPSPEIEGEAMVCDWSEELYAVADNEGSTYSWVATNGSITEGQGTYMVTVSWEGEGVGSLTVTEETADGCEGSSELFNVTIDDCTGIDDKNLESHLTINPNPVNGNNIAINTGSSSKVIIEIFAIDGTLAIKKEVNNPVSMLNIEGLSKGIYFLKAMSENKQEVVLKFIRN